MLNEFLQFVLLTSLINVTTYGSNSVYNQINNALNNSTNNIINTISRTQIDLSGKVNNNKQPNIDNNMSVDIEIDVNNNNIEQNTNNINQKIDLSKKISNKKLNGSKNKKIIGKKNNVTTYGSNNIYNQLNNNMNNCNNNFMNTISNTLMDLSGQTNNNKQSNMDNNMSMDIDIDVNNNNIEQNNNDINHKIDLSKKIRNNKLNRHKNRKIIGKKDLGLNNHLNKKKVKLKYIRDIKNICRNNTLQYSDFFYESQKRTASKKALDIITAYCHNNNLFNTNNYVNKNGEHKIGNRGKLKNNNTKKKRKLTEEERAKRDGYYSIFEDFAAAGSAPNDNDRKLPYYNVYRKLWNDNKKNNVIPLEEENDYSNNINSDNNNNQDKKINIEKYTKLKAPVFADEDSIQNDQTNNNNQINNTNLFSNSNILRNNYFSTIKHNYNDNQYKLLNNNKSNNSSIWNPIITPTKRLNIIPYNNNHSDYFNKKNNNIINYSEVGGKNLYLDFNNCDNKALTTFETPQKNIQELNNFKSLLNNSSVILNNRHDNFKMNQENLYLYNNVANNNNNTQIKKNLLSELNSAADDNLAQNNLTKNNNNYTHKKSENNYIHLLINTVTRLLEEDPKLKDEIMTPELKNNTIKNDSTNYQTNIKNNNKLHINEVNNSSIKKDLYNDFSFESNDNINKNAENIEDHDYLSKK